MGPIEYFEYESMEGRGKNNHGLPRFRECSLNKIIKLSLTLSQREGHERI